eukprot:3867025-Amphidinium_carterae.1
MHRLLPLLKLERVGPGAPEKSDQRLEKLRFNGCALRKDGYSALVETATETCLGVSTIVDECPGEAVVQCAMQAAQMSAHRMFALWTHIGAKCIVRRVCLAWHLQKSRNDKESVIVSHQRGMRVRWSKQ